MQPIDLDRDSLDDRILGVYTTSGNANRLATDLSRGVAYVADGSNGITILQLLPPRINLLDVLRDPLSTDTGDEESIVSSREAYLSDDALQIKIRAVLPPQSGLSLSIEEIPEGGGPSLVAFSDGSISIPLVQGENEQSIQIFKVPGTVGSLVVLRIEEVGGGVIKRFDLNLVEAQPTGELESLFVAPEWLFITADQQEARVGVGGIFSDGRIFNLTSASSGTEILPDNPAVVSIDDKGIVAPLAGGTTSIFVNNQEFSANSIIRVWKAPVITEIEVDKPFVTLTASGELEAILVTATLSDGSIKDVSDDPETVYHSSPEGIVSVSPGGLITADAEGSATVTVSNGAFSRTIRVAVEFIVTPEVTGIDLAPFAGLVTTDMPVATATATITGTGSLQGLPVTFTLGGLNVTERISLTDGSGVAMVAFIDLDAADSATVTASVMNPTGGNTLSDSEQLVVVAGSGDHEPNNILPSAFLLNDDRKVIGTVGTPVDPQDVYKSEHTTNGTITIDLSVANEADPGEIAIIVHAADGTEIGHFQPDSQADRFEQQLNNGGTYITIEGGDTLTSYSIATSFRQDEVVIDDVSPTGGGTGTEVTISGSGFSADPEENRVIFGGAVAKVIESDVHQVKAVVPANAADGPMVVISRYKAGFWPFFATGNTVPPPIDNIAPDLSMLKLDPVSGVVINGTRLRVNFDPLVNRAEVETLAAGINAIIAGSIPLFNTYILDFPEMQTIAQLETMRDQLEADNRVAFASFSALAEPLTGGRTIDARDRSIGLSTVQNPTANISTATAYAQANFFEAIDAVRRSASFVSPAALQPVKVAIIDTGFAPKDIEEFKDKDGDVVVRLMDAYNPSFGGGTTMQEASTLADPHGHGTEVTSIVAATNNDKGLISGMLSSLFQPDEKPSAEFTVYRVADNSGNIHIDAVMRALNDIWLRLSEYDIINLSFTSTYQHAGAQYTRDSISYSAAFVLLQPSILIVMAAGSGNVDNSLNLPSNLALPATSAIMSIGAVAVANGDNTSETTDARALYRNGGSNFGLSVTLAAPGEDVFVHTMTRANALGYTDFSIS